MAFYRYVARIFPGGLVPRLLFRPLDDNTSRFSLLLETTRRPRDDASEWPVPPTDEQCRRIVQCTPTAAFLLGSPGSSGRRSHVHRMRPTDWFTGTSQRFAAKKKKKIRGSTWAVLSPLRRRIYERAIRLRDRLADRHRTRDI
jgi:hypothetical protein